MAAAMKRVVGRLSNLSFRLNQSIYGLSCRSLTQANNELTEDVEYPDIVPKYPPGKWSEDLTPKVAWRWYEESKRLHEIRDVRERLENISGEKDKFVYMTKSWDKLKRTLSYQQHITRTHIIDGLPEVYESLNVDKEYERLKPVIENAILQESEYRYKRQNETKPSNCTTEMLGLIINNIITGCAHENRHLLTSQLGKNVRVETFWRVAGFEKSYDSYNIGRLWMQYKDEAAFQLRTELPLPEYLPMDHELCVSGEIPECDYHPKVYGFQHQQTRPITVSGHWVGDPCEFTHLTCQVPGQRYDDTYSELEGRADMADIIADGWKQCGLTSSFAACVAQAHNQGFNVHHDVTYPFTTQALICHKNHIQFFTYQLNTFQLWLNREDHPANNVLWVGPKLQLYEDVENGEVRGLNELAIKQLLKFAVLKTADRGYDLRPNLAPEDAPVLKEKYINNIGEDMIEVPKIGRFQYPRNALYF